MAQALLGPGYGPIHVLPACNTLLVHLFAGEANLWGITVWVSTPGKDSLCERLYLPNFCCDVVKVSPFALSP